ncbi:hypothetical protein H0H93_010499 [Arthromyces matolae]|nr:hypothetical protein H0H93_010499 [Arthromyces matolae]
MPGQQVFTLHASFIVRDMPREILLCLIIARPKRVHVRHFLDVLRYVREGWIPPPQPEHAISVTYEISFDIQFATIDLFQRVGYEFKCYREIDQKFISFGPFGVLLVRTLRRRRSIMITFFFFLAVFLSTTVTLTNAVAVPPDVVSHRTTSTGPLSIHDLLGVEIGDRSVPSMAIEARAGEEGKSSNSFNSSRKRRHSSGSSASNAITSTRTDHRASAGEESDGKEPASNSSRKRRRSRSDSPSSDSSTSKDSAFDIKDAAEQIYRYILERISEEKRGKVYEQTVQEDIKEKALEALRKIRSMSEGDASDVEIGASKIRSVGRLEDLVIARLKEAGVDPKLAKDVALGFAAAMHKEYLEMMAAITGHKSEE